MEATRTLVKSPPELWAELSDVAALTRHLGEFGEIRITRTEPESVVEWEGDRASGSVRLEPSGWGTRVTLTVDPPAEAKAAEPPEPVETADPTDAVPIADDVRGASVAEPAGAMAAAEPTDSTDDPGAPSPAEQTADTPATGGLPDGFVSTQPEPDSEADATPRRGFFARLFGWRSRRAARKARSAEEHAAPDRSGEPATTEEPESVAAEQAAPDRLGEPATTEEPESVADEPPGTESEALAADEPPGTVETEPDPTPESVAAEQPPADDTDAAAVHDSEPDAAAILAQTLDALGAAHHRPFSR